MITQWNIGFRPDQIEWINANPDFKINQFCRDKLDEYREEKNETING